MLSYSGQDFLDEASKVAFMLSYLKGSHARLVPDRGHPRLIRPHVYGLVILDPSVYRQTPFGPHDPVNEATVCIENLRYKDAGKAVKYTLDFNRDVPCRA